MLTEDEEMIYSGPMGICKAKFSRSGPYTNFRTFQRVNDSWVLRDVFESEELAEADALHGAGLLKRKK